MNETTAEVWAVKISLDLHQLDTHSFLQFLTSSRKSLDVFNQWRDCGGEADRYAIFENGFLGYVLYTLLIDIRNVSLVCEKVKIYFSRTPSSITVFADHD